MLLMVPSSCQDTHLHPSPIFHQDSSAATLQVEERRDSFLPSFAAMETSSCHVFYVDRRVESQTMEKTTPLKSTEVQEVRTNLDSLLSTFPTGRCRPNSLSARDC